MNTGVCVRAALPLLSLTSVHYNLVISSLASVHPKMEEPRIQSQTYIKDIWIRQGPTHFISWKYIICENIFCLSKQLTPCCFSADAQFACPGNGRRAWEGLRAGGVAPPVNTGTAALPPGILCQSYRTTGTQMSEKKTSKKNIEIPTLKKKEKKKKTHHVSKSPILGSKGTPEDSSFSPWDKRAYSKDSPNWKEKQWMSKPWKLAIKWQQI